MMMKMTYQKWIWEKRINCIVGSLTGLKLFKFHNNTRSEEAWSSYNDKREALPKAAFQFGVKMGDGRKTKKNQSKSKEKKLDNELKKINNVGLLLFSYNF
jgi:hypothetical protein